jgi:undecaprenyl diphosphate synthase
MGSDALRTDGLPRHVAIIMDGNGRWAERRGLSRVEGHRAGKEAVSAVVRAAGDLGIEVLTLYAFSIENWNRPQSEVTELMRLAERYLEEELPEVMANDIQVRAIGRLDRLPPRVRTRIEHAVATTRDNGSLKLVFALSYGGRAEIVDAARRIARDAEQGRLDPDAVDEKVFASHLYDPELPDPDLLIRTGGECASRTSCSGRSRTPDLRVGADVARLRAEHPPSAARLPGRSAAFTASAQLRRKAAKRLAVLGAR